MRRRHCARELHTHTHLGDSLVLILHGTATSLAQTITWKVTTHGIMASPVLLSFVALLATIVSVWAQPQPGMSMVVKPMGLVKAEDTLFISCFAENIGGGRVVKLYKYQPQAAAEVTLFSNDAIESKYEAVDRFSLTYNRTFPDDETKAAHYGFHFVIAGAIAEDSGTYRCALTGDQPAEDTQRIDVIEPPTDIELFIGDADAEIAIDQDGQEVELMAGERREVRCHVTGGNPAPTMKIMAGDEDLTAQFEVNTRTTEHPTELEGMFRPEADVNVINRNQNGMKMEYKFNGKDVGCYAYVQDQEEPALSRYFTAKFQGVKPEFIKCQREVLAFTNQANVNITCTLQASPQATMSKITWKNENNVTIELGLGKENGRYSAKLQEVDGEMALVLFIDIVKPQTFRQYTFIAENELGSSEFVVNFTKDPADPWVDSGSEVATASAVTVGFLLVVHAFLHL